jgi:hypothetical protein
MRPVVKKLAENAENTESGGLEKGRTMSGQRRSLGSVGGGVPIAIGLSAVFVGLTVATNPLVAALVVVPVSIAVGALLARAVPRATPHSLAHPSFGAAAVVHATKVSGSVGSASASPAA